jgi:ribonucleoside-diphosphate reductase alpha chain
VQTNARKLNDAIDAARPRASSTSACARCTTATCCGTRTRKVIETPQQFFLRIACA